MSESASAVMVNQHQKSNENGKLGVENTSSHHYSSEEEGPTIEILK